MTIRVVLGDDNVLVREGVRALLSATDGVEVVGVAEDAPTLLAAAEEHLPDVVVTDIKMPPNFQLEGIECAHEIRDRHPGTGVVVLSSHDDEAYALALLGGGDKGLAYLIKDRLGRGDDLPRAIREVANGGSLIDPTIAARLSGADSRTEADREVLDLMARGLTYAEMAATLGSTPEAIDRMVTTCSSGWRPRGTWTCSSGCTPPWWTARRRPGSSGRSSPPRSPSGWPAATALRCRRSWRPPSCSPTSAGSPRSPSASRRGRSPPSSAATCRPWPRWWPNIAAPSTSSPATA